MNPSKAHGKRQEDPRPYDYGIQRPNEIDRRSAYNGARLILASRSRCQNRDFNPGGAAPLALWSIHGPKLIEEITVGWITYKPCQGCYQEMIDVTGWNKKEKFTARCWDCRESSSQVK